jgi:hypothetical protein
MDKPRWYISWLLGYTSGVIAGDPNIKWWIGLVLCSIGAVLAVLIERYRSARVNQKNSQALDYIPHVVREK